MRAIRLLLFAGIVLANLMFTAPRTSAGGDFIRALAFGDSYSSGNGALDYEDQNCWRSANAYIHQYTARLRDAGYKATSGNYACMSAVTADVFGQMDAAGNDLEVADIVTMTIGGNNANFANLVAECFGTDSYGQFGDCQNWIDLANQKMDAIVINVSKLLRAFHTRAPQANIVLVGYPYLIGANCPSTSFEHEIRVLEERVDSLLNAMVDHLNNELADGRLRYLSTLDAFNGHEVCGSSYSYIRGSFDTWHFEEWFHPNVEGHAKISDLLVGMRIQPTMPSSEPPSSPSYQQPTASNVTDGYTRLPFDCGTLIPYVSTYDAYNYNGRVLYHGNAVDIPMPSGTPVVAAYDGQVFVHYDPTGLGYFVDLVNNNNITLRMAHLRPTVEVTDGQAVRRGDLIGYVGESGATTGPHLHYERRDGSAIVVNSLGGPDLLWGQPQNTSGYRVTTHSLRSANCSGLDSSEIVEPADIYADLMVYERGTIRYARSDGYDNRNWEIAFEGIMNPHTAVACDFDGDGWDEYISYEHLNEPQSRIMMGDPKGDGQFGWTHIWTVNSNTDNIACGDWNNDGRDDVIIHVTGNGRIRVGLSSGKDVSSVKTLYEGMAPPTFWDICDLNGDGRQDIVSYEGGGGRLAVGFINDSGNTSWKVIRRDVYDVGGMTCGNFTNFAHDEIVLWQPANDGHYKVGRFGDEFAMFNWERIDPQGLKQPFEGELRHGDIDGDGFDEFIVNEYRPSRGNHSVMVGNFTSRTTFTWHPFIEGVFPKDVVVGRFIA